MKQIIQDDLFDLIHSLDSAERGYFSKYAQRHVLGDRNNYEALFQMILQMPVYEQEALEAALKEKGIHTPLAGVKTQLKGIIFRAMREFYSSHSTYKVLLDGLANLHFLYDKKLYDLLRKELKKLKKTALLHEAHHILFKIGDFERRLHKETARKGFVEGMEAILSEMKQYAADFQNQLEFTHLMDRAFVIANKGGSNQIQDIEDLIASPLLSGEDEPTTTLSKIYMHQVKAIASMIKLDYPQSLQEYATVMRLWEEAPHMIEESPSTYRRILGNFLGISGSAFDFSRFEELIQKVRDSPCHQPAHKVEVFSISYTNELTWRMGTHDWVAAESLIPKIQDGLIAHEAFLSPATALSLRYNCAIFYFLGENYSACLQWLRDIMAVSRVEQRMDIQRIARILHLLLIWKRGDFQLLEYEYRSTQRFFENHGSSSLETIAMKLVQELINAISSEDNMRAWKAFESQLCEPSMNNFIGVLELRAWALAQTSQQKPRVILQRLM